VNKQKAKIIWKFMQKTVNDNNPSPSAVTVDLFASFLMRYFAFGDEDQARYYLQYLAPELISLMQEKRRRTYEWAELPIYDDLIEAKLPSATKRKMAAVELERRTQPLPDESDEASSGASESSEEEILTEEQMQHRSMSGLRPKSSSKFSGKGRGKKGKGPQKVTITEEEEEEDAMDVDTPIKRKSSDEDSTGDYPSKRFTRSQGNEDPELEDLEFEIQQAKSTGLPIRRKASRSTNSDTITVRPIILSEPIFSTEATDPGDIWKCPHDGCVHKVYGASENGELIKEHLAEHKEKDKISLIRSEENRTHLPVRYVVLSTLPIKNTNY
jgi:hypothetical protein